MALGWSDHAALSTFTYAGNDLRVIDREGNPWFVAKDVCDALGYRSNNRGMALTILNDDQRTLMQIEKGVRSLVLISESGLNKLTMRSDKPAARAFQDWVTRDVLPAIRKGGAYIMGD